MFEDDIIPQAAANLLDVTVENVMQTRKKLKHWTNLLTSGIISVLELTMISSPDGCMYKNQSQVARMCKTLRKTVKKVLDNPESIRTANIFGTSICIKSSL